MDEAHQLRFLGAMREFFPAILDKILPRMCFFEIDIEGSVYEYIGGGRNVVTSFRML